MVSNTWLSYPRPGSAPKSYYKSFKYNALDDAWDPTVPMLVGAAAGFTSMRGAEGSKSGPQMWLDSKAARLALDEQLPRGSLLQW